MYIYSLFDWKVKDTVWHMLFLHVIYLVAALHLYSIKSYHFELCIAMPVITRKFSGVRHAHD